MKIAWLGYAALKTEGGKITFSEMPIVHPGGFSEL
jgi:hypothetical protein